MNDRIAALLVGTLFCGCGSATSPADAEGPLGGDVSSELMQPPLPELVTRGSTAQASAATRETPREEARNPAYPVPQGKLTKIKGSLVRSLEELSRKIETDPENAELSSRRGSAYFLDGQFEKATADFDREVELEPSRLPAHWRRGIALYYAGRYEESANQFGDYHTQDSYGDRENGIWHFLANAARFGVDVAREKMLLYTKDDHRPMMNRVYALYAGKTTAEEVLANIESANLDPSVRDRQLFYAHLYIGWLAVAEKKPDRARAHLYEAVANKWGQTAGGGPGYMWHTARVHYDLLVKPSDDEG